MPHTYQLPDKGMGKIGHSRSSNADLNPSVRGHSDSGNCDESNLRLSAWNHCSPHRRVVLPFEPESLLPEHRPAQPRFRLLP